MISRPIGDGEPKPAEKRWKRLTLLASITAASSRLVALSRVPASRRGMAPRRLFLCEQGPTSRIRTRFFLRGTSPKPAVVLHLPRLPRMDEAQEQGYFFRTADDEEAFAAAVVEDVIRYAQPLFQRFTSASEVQRGFEDGTFKPHLPVERSGLDLLTRPVQFYLRMHGKSRRT